MTALKAIVFYLVLPAALIGGCIWVKSTGLYEDRKATAASRPLGGREYLRRKFFHMLRGVMEEDGGVYLKGFVHNKGDRYVSDFRVRVACTKGLETEVVLSLGSVMPGERQEVDEYIGQADEGGFQYQDVYYTIDVLGVYFDDE